MRYIISGTSGFLGSKLLEKAISLNNHVLGVNRRKITDSITYDELEESSFSADVFIHCASLVHEKNKPYNDFFVTNVALTINLAKWCKKNHIKKFIYISTIGVYGDCQEISKLTKPVPNDNYSKSKFEAEQKLITEFSNSSIKLIIIRSPLIIGKNAPGNVYNIERLLKFFPITPFKLVKNKKIYVKIDTIVDFLINNKEHNSMFYIPAEPEMISTKGLFDLVASYNNKKFLHFPIPLNIMKFFLTVTNKKEYIKILFGSMEVKNV
jgi:UDP-glucose 4-epimerase